MNVQQKVDKIKEHLDDLFEEHRTQEANRNKFYQYLTAVKMYGHISDFDIIKYYKSTRIRVKFTIPQTGTLNSDCTHFCYFDCEPDVKKQERQLEEAYDRAMSIL